MPTLKFDVTRDTMERLQVLAERERRYVTQQAEVILMQSLGLWPDPVDASKEGSRAAK